MNGILLFFLTLAVVVSPAYCSLPQSFRLDVARADAADAASLNLTDSELLRRAVKRSWERLASIAPRGGGAGAGSGAVARKAAVAEAPMMPGGGEYLVKVGIGTPEHVFTAVIDTASDLVWTQCQPCAGGCSGKSGAALFNPNVSSSYTTVPCRSGTCGQLGTHRCSDDDDDACQYAYSYSGNATTEGTLAVDKLAIGSDAFHDVVFGCSSSSSGVQPPQASGVVGLGRGPLSLVSQLPVRRFMYCLPPPASKSVGKLVLGADAGVVRNATDRVVVPMAANPLYPSYYYLNLNGLAVGDKFSSFKKANATEPPSPSPPAGGADSHGMIIDIASTISFLEASLYEELASDLEEEIRLPRGSGSPELGLDLCFILPEPVPMSRVYVPPVWLAFDGEWLRLERERLFVEDKARGMMCLMVGKTNGSVSILGNFQQQNMQVLYSLRRGRITFVKKNCELML